jgi:hypothetical protein
MSTINPLFSAATFAIAAVLFTAPAVAHADTYQFFNLVTANSHAIFGIDTSGTVVVVVHDPLPYQTYTDGVLTNSSATIPNLDYSNGTPCTPAVSAPVTWSPDIGKTRCNNGHEVYSGTIPAPPPQQKIEGIFTGPDPTDHLTDPSDGRVDSSPLDMVVMNASGDFAWVDGRDEIIFEAIDLTTAPIPEPGSILLVGTGIFWAAAGAMRRRFLQSS